MKSKIVLGLCLIVVFSLVLSGCGPGAPPEEPSYAEKAGIDMEQYNQERAARDEEMREMMEEMRDIPSGDMGMGGGSECVLFEQCDSSDDLCWFGLCWTEEELHAKYAPCENRECNAPCENCDGGTEMCILATAAGASSYYICVDCLIGGCNEGYECKSGRCI